MLGLFFDMYTICSLYFAACRFSLITKFGPLPSKNPRCAPVFQTIVAMLSKYLKNICEEAQF